MRFNAGAEPDDASKTILSAGAVEPDRSDDMVSLHRLRSAVLELFSALRETLRDERSSAAERLQRAAALLDALERQPAPAAYAPRQGLAPWQLRRVLTHIEASLGTQIRNEDLAGVAGLSTFHFNVAFRNSVGDSPHQYVIRRRIERAQGLMLATDSSLSDIATQCGLADQAHLTRLFRRVVGETPAAWRRARENPSHDSLNDRRANARRARDAREPRLRAQ